jgi:RNA recognition motif-containing protein
MTYTLFVRPVSHLSNDTIRRTFSEFGEVIDVHVPRTFKTKKRQPYCYVKYNDKHAAARAVSALHDQTLLGKQMSVMWADEAPKTPEEMIERKRQRREALLKQQEDGGAPPEHPRDRDRDRDRDSDRDRERDRERDRPPLPLHAQFFTAVDYPEGIGEEFTPIYQRNLPPVGQRRHFFSWVCVTEEQKARILREELERQLHSERRRE